MVAKSLFHTFELSFSFDFMILEHDIANANEHFGWRRQRISYSPPSQSILRKDR